MRNFVTTLANSKWSAKFKKKLYVHDIIRKEITGNIKTKESNTWI
jgi:hypothetical protein